MSGAVRTQTVSTDLLAPSLPGLPKLSRDLITHGSRMYLSHQMDSRFLKTRNGSGKESWLPHLQHSLSKVVSLHTQTACSDFRIIKTHSSLLKVVLEDNVNKIKVDYKKR